MTGYRDLEWTHERTPDARHWSVTGRHPGRAAPAVRLEVRACAPEFAPEDIAKVAALMLRELDPAVGDLIEAVHPGQPQDGAAANVTRLEDRRRSRSDIIRPSNPSAR